MATVSYSSAQQFDIYDLFYGESPVLSSIASTKITLESGNHLLELTGSGFNLNTLAGTITGFKLFTVDGESGTPRAVLSQTGSFATGLSLRGLSEAMDADDAMASAWYRAATYLHAHNDVITGSAYGDEMVGFAGNDKLAGGDGDDFLMGDGWYSGYMGEPGASAGNDTLDGGNGNDELMGGDGSDLMTGGAGNDFLDGESGADKMLGGTGDDYYVVDSAADQVTELSAQGSRDTVEVLASGTFTSYTLGANVENMKIDVYMSYYEDSTFTARGNSLGNKIGLTYDSDASEKLYGYAGNDRLSSGAGNDTLDGGTGNDTMLGGDENDLYHVDSNLDRVIEDAASEWGGVDTVVYNMATASTASLGGTVSGLIRNITFSGIENLTLGSTSATVALHGIGNTGANTLTGNAAANKLHGLAGNDVLVGNGGTDTLYGDSGNDLLRGGTGNDILNGGSGTDLFRLDTALNASTNVDQIRDFVAADDTIQLENAIFTRFGATTTGVIGADKFTANSTGRASDSNDYIVYETDTGKLFYDADGSGAGASVQIALIGTLPSLTHADFVLV
ncbi:MAG: calcium-binding protein [Thauera sp.]